MTVTTLFELFLLRKITVLILLVIFNIAAFFAYDLVSMNHQLESKLIYPISVDGSNIVDTDYIENKFSTDSVTRNVLRGVDKTSYKIMEVSKYLDVAFVCDVKENCLTASKLLLDSLDNEAKIIIESNKIKNEIEVSKIKASIKNLNNKRKALISTEEEYFQVSEKNIDKANNLDNLSSMLLLQDINNERQEAMVYLTNINNNIYTAEMELKHYSILNKVKHFFKWIAEPNIENINQRVSLSLWLTLSFLMSMALYFIAAVLTNTKQT